ncbi:hypothetical protein CDL15_Pgr006532 [Punica granatum]|uniref:Uncharacterized protein n=1 Tax=Punica granatum TaxID=22663 RepID=A0A218Y092_PUNGR|nr:hypothetical protein CDL15_Pgr006532 [Punica granatum]
MVRVCDELIEVFIVDKPTPTDWRRLLAFSREWSNIRPHFYKRCQDRADSVDDPGMKHKLLRLSRKLKEDDLIPHFYLCRTPEELHTAIRTVIEAYRFSREGTLIREARDLMNPKIVEKLDELKKLLEDKYM